MTSHDCSGTPLPATRTVRAPASGARLFRAAALLLGLGLAAAGPAHAQTAISCPERAKTTTVALADPAQAKDFKIVVGGDTSSQTWLQDVAVLTASGTRIAGVANGKKQITWAFDGQSPVTIACIYEGGVSLVRTIERPKGCSAAIQRSKDPGGGSWGMDKATFTCR
ncbi:STY0301 family protein [Aquabacter cavernae]|uniref:STY0301 family protein n=1 Tax=Aquabacter cavernae TaxID=2496029 RepID=UPI000F8DAFA0|nr:STY0301 family protein [Aquabacter cavernae]